MAMPPFLRKLKAATAAVAIPATKTTAASSNSMAQWKFVWWRAMACWGACG